MARKTRPWGPGTSAVVRALVAADAPLTQTALASLVGVSQPRVSQVLTYLSRIDAVDMTTTGYIGRRDQLIDLYLARHRPTIAAPDTAWYNLHPMGQQVNRACAHAYCASVRVAVSADLAPDLLTAWRHPTLTVIYANGALDLASVGFVPAEGRIDATVLVRHVADSTLLAACAPWPPRATAIPVVDPVQQIWDLHDLGGEDRVEAAGRLRQAVLDRTLQPPS